MSRNASSSAVVISAKCSNPAEVAQAKNCFSKIVFSLSRVESARFIALAGKEPFHCILDGNGLGSPAGRFAGTDCGRALFRLLFKLSAFVFCLFPASGVGGLANRRTGQDSTNPLRTTAALPEAIRFLGAIGCVAGVNE